MNNFYQIHKISDRVTQISDITGVSVFLVKGENRALLIDTAMGLRGLKETVDHLTDLPYDVVLTHGHGDHAGGSSVFANVFLNQADKPLIFQHDFKWRSNYIYGMLKYSGNPLHIEFEPDKDLIPTSEPDKHFLPLQEGMVFDLGGIRVEMLAFPGHTKGMMCPLILEERTILFGDACNPNTLVGSKESTTISEYLASLKRIKSVEDRFDDVLLSHGDVFGTKQYLEDNIELCEKILENTDAHMPFSEILGEGFLAAKWDRPFHREDGKYGNIFYTDLTAK